MKLRGFEKVSTYINKEFELPKRQTLHSAGYDFCILEDIVFKPNQKVMINSGVKVYMQKDEFLQIHIRSSIGAKKNLRLMNSVGIIDADYYNDPKTEGHIMFPIINCGDKEVVLKKGERITQGIFLKYLTVDNDEKVKKESRKGGFGSTEK